MTEIITMLSTNENYINGNGYHNLYRCHSYNRYLKKKRLPHIMGIPQFPQYIVIVTIPLSLHSDVNNLAA